MLTPAYALTATERVLPRMALDFTTASLDSRVTVTRALNTATRVNSSGFIENVNADLPRFDFDPVALTCKGLLIEESRANISLYSSDFSQATWNKGNTTVSSNSVVSPDGTQNADTMVATAISGVHYVLQSITTTAAAHTFSIYAKPAGYNFLFLYNGTVGQGRVFNVSNGAKGGTAGNPAPTSDSITPVGNGWYRCTITVTCTAAANSFRAYVMETDAATASFTGDGTSGLYVWGAQVEAGAFATSYIPTTTTSLTRNADAVSMTGTNFSDWYNATEGTFRAIGANFGVSATAGYSPFFVASDGTNNNRIRVSRSTGTSSTLIRANIVAATAPQFNLDAFLALDALGNVVLSYKSTGAAYALNGGTPATNGAFTVPTVNKLNIGIDDSGLAVFNGWVQKISYWPQQLTTAEVQAFSK